jgi:hypothetical protein
MDVEVNDGHPLSAVDQVSSRNGDIVEEAKPHRLARYRVVARWANRQEGQVGVAPAKAGDRLEAGTGSP